MQSVTVVLLEHQEKDMLLKCRPFIGIGAPPGPPEDPNRHRTEWERRWNHVSQQGELISHEALSRALEYGDKTLAQIISESRMDYWQLAWADEVRSHGLKPEDLVFPTHMAEYLATSRLSMIRDLVPALEVIAKALTCTPKPVDDEI